MISSSHYLSLPFHCSPWQMQCGLCHHADRNVASYVPPHLPQPSPSGSLQPERQVSLHQHRQVNRPTCILPTDANLYVVAIRGVFKVVDGAHHVQGHVTNVMSVIFCLLWSPGYHHVGISNSLNLVKDRSSCRYDTARMYTQHIKLRENTHKP